MAADFNQRASKLAFCWKAELCQMFAKEHSMKPISLPKLTVRTLTITACLGLSLASAQAADYETDQSGKHDWEGMYFGGAVDVSKSGVDISGFGKEGDFDIKEKKKVIGGTAIAGYNFTSGPWVFGAEGTLGSVGLKETTSITGLGNVNAESNWIGTVGLRGGYAIDNLLIFGTAGLAFSDLKASSSLGGNFKKTVPGAVVGIGAEYAFDDNWSARAELLGYAFRGDATLNGSKRNLDLGHGVARLGLTYKF
jgi:outer membrane immunogenic protein